MTDCVIIGGGLAGSEAALTVASFGLKVELFEMRPQIKTGAHATQHLAELVCSNSLGSKLSDRATGLLLEELKILKSPLIKIAEDNQVPAGGALAVDREKFSSQVTRVIENHPLIEIHRKECVTIPNQLCILATGPLTSAKMAAELSHLSDQNHLYFFDAISPIVLAESIDMKIAFKASRYGKGERQEGDYINCPFNKQEYENFVLELTKAERIPLKEFEEKIKQGVTAGTHTFFEGCLPVEIIAGRGLKSLAFGPMRPVGLDDPQTGKRPYAVLQLRQDNLAASLYNMVGFQTNLKFGEQERIFRMVPGLKNAEFIRFGQMHRNTFLASPMLLNSTLEFKNKENLFVAGQLTGVEGYMGNIATGHLAGLNAVRKFLGKSLLSLPLTTMLGALCHYVTNALMKDFQPMKANFGIMPELTNKPKNKQDRAKAYSLRAQNDLKIFLEPLAFSRHNE